MKLPALFVVGWAIQFVGHLFEGRKPAFMDDLVGLLVGPLFIVAEWGFALGLRKELLAAIENQLRSYRVSRISQAEVLDQPAQFPEEFNLEQFWQQSTTKFKSQLPNYKATFRVSPEVFPRLPFAGRFARVGEAGTTDERGWIAVEVGFDVEEMACEYALSFGSKLEVLAPASLREKVIEMAQEIVDSYN